MKSKLQQSYSNLCKALESLKKAVESPPIEDRDYGGIIQAFEFVYELTWKTLKLILESNQIEAPFPRIVFEEAFKADLIEGNEIWKEIIEDRNLATHTYDQALAVKLCKKIQEHHVVVFDKTVQKMKPYAK